jgi:hypothetical protein
MFELDILVLDENRRRDLDTGSLMTRRRPSRKRWADKIIVSVSAHNVNMGWTGAYHCGRLRIDSGRGLRKIGAYKGAAAAAVLRAAG